MLITKEQQEELVYMYVKDNHTTDECIGFIDGVNSIMELIGKIDKEKGTADIEKILIDFLSFLNENGYINDYDFVYETQIKKFIKQIKTNKMEVITDLNEIDRSTKEGRLLFAALAKITTESQTDKTPYEVLEQLEDLATKMD